MDDTIQRLGIEDSLKALRMGAALKFVEENDLISEAIGGKVIFATDDFFAQAENMLKLENPVWKEGEFTEFGKWMDGWETRRKRTPGHDWCIIQLGAPGVIHGFDVDTSYFTGNFCPTLSIQGANLEKELPGRSTENRMGTKASEEDFKVVEKLKSEDWPVLLEQNALSPGYKATCHNYYTVDHSDAITHIRVNMFPDGGIARLKVYGKVRKDWSKVPLTEVVDLVSQLNGGINVGFTDNHFGHPRNMILPGRARIMAEGWETARRLDRPSVLEADNNGVIKIPDASECCEWAEFKLGCPGIVQKIEIDTNHFKGNFPDNCFVEACYSPESEGEILEDEAWKMLLDAQKLSAHTRHYYDCVNDVGVVTHVKVTIVPDGGISRLRIWGTRSEMDTDIDGEG